MGKKGPRATESRAIARELAKFKFEEYARSTDFVEILDPEGALEGEGPYRITQRGLQIIRFYVDAGLFYATIAERIGLTMKDFTKCVQDQPEVAEVLAQGKAVEEFELKELLMGQARRGNIIAIIFALKARHGWSDQQKGEAAPQNFQLVINAPLTTEDYKRLREENISPLQLHRPKTEQDYKGPMFITQGEEVKIGGAERKD